jgi:hypothetical protein
MGTRNSYKIWVENRPGKRQLGRGVRRWNYGIRLRFIKTDPEEVI